MAEYPYSLSIGRMKEFLVSKMPAMGRPDKVTLKTLEAQGFKSTNDRTILPLLKFLGIIDESGTPTSAWMALRDRENSRKVFAALVRSAYADVFTSYPEAHNVSEKDIRNHMAAHSKSNERIVGAMVGVFKMLCSLADFESEAVSPEEVAANRPGTDKLSRGTEKLSKEPLAVEGNGLVTVNFNLTIGEGVTPEQIEMIFKCAAKYLMGRDV